MELQGQLISVLSRFVLFLMCHVTLFEPFMGLHSEYRVSGMSDIIFCDCSN